jgi:hypothetical protein
MEEEFDLKKVAKQLGKLSKNYPRQKLAMAKLLSKRPTFYSAN